MCFDINGICLREAMLPTAEANMTTSSYLFSAAVRDYNSDEIDTRRKLCMMSAMLYKIKKGGRSLILRPSPQNLWCAFRTRTSVHNNNNNNIKTIAQAKLFVCCVFLYTKGGDAGNTGYSDPSHLKLIFSPEHLANLAQEGHSKGTGPPTYTHTHNLPGRGKSPFETGMLERRRRIALSYFGTLRTN